MDPPVAGPDGNCMVALGITATCTAVACRVTGSTAATCVPAVGTAAACLAAVGTAATCPAASTGAADEAGVQAWLLQVQLLH